MSRVTYRGRDQWSSNGAPRHYQLPLVVEQDTRAYWWWLAILLIGFIVSGALFLGSLR